MIRLLVCGGRDYEDQPAAFAALDRVASRYRIAVVIEGGARGADRLGRQWAEARRLAVETYPAQWRKYGHSAGPVRNTQMLRDGKPDMVVAFPGGNGTADMVRKSERAGVKVWRPYG